MIHRLGPTGPGQGVLKQLEIDFTHGWALLDLEGINHMELPSERTSGINKNYLLQKESDGTIFNGGKPLALFPPTIKLLV